MSSRKRNCSRITSARKYWEECWTLSRSDGGNRAKKISKNIRRKCYDLASGGNRLTGQRKSTERTVRPIKKKIHFVKK